MKIYYILLILVILFLLLVLIQYRTKTEGFCHTKNAKNLKLGSDVLVPKDIVANNFTLELPFYRVGTNHTSQKCQDLSISLVNKVSNGELTNEEANKQWVLGKCE